MEGAIVKAQKKLLWPLLVVILVGLWCVRYIALNRSFATNENFSATSVTYQLGEKIQMADNLMEMSATADGYSVIFECFEILSRDEALNKYGLTEADVYSEYSEVKEDKFVVVQMLATNEGNEGDALYLEDFTLYGLNWWTGLLYEWTQAINQGNLHYTCEIGETNTVYLVYEFPAEFDGADGMEQFLQENIYINLTYYPVKINVALQ